MKNIAEKELLNLGFERQDVSVEESGDKPFYYFTLDIGGLCLISNADDECIDRMYSVQFFDYDDAVTFVDVETLTKLVELLLSCRKDGRK